MFKSNKAQASIEFIVSYGWVLLIVVTTVGVLFYFNVFDVNKYLPDDCEFGKNIQCQDMSIQKDGSTIDLLFKLRNNLEKPIELTDLYVLDDENNELSCLREFHCPPEIGALNWSKSREGANLLFKGSWYVGNSCALEMNCDYTSVQGSKDRFTINLTYRRQTPSNNAPLHSIYGKAFGTIQ